ncbi:O-antigen ligase family protein [Aliiglaciecola sp. LCG003]|uniref:O-antigen ligase family protein n=1 Tax=Aliiglaciecola sp. LCG003 TaxID=3053655 RepID=UPI00257221A4|nr:O-antigen ligase family protein [Aliiglaciecola sp. LCG003]WJG10406.1 O-antigen ligase family protein [Aliiglaciecola sp. LCG003]
MPEDFINLIAPPFFILLWGRFCIQNKSTNLKICALFFTSIVCFSQNFSLIFRELHQLIQVFIAGFFLILVVQKKSFHKILLFPLVFLFLILASLLFAPFDNDAKSQFINYLVVISVLSFLLITLKDNRDLILILRFIGELAFLTACFGIVEYVLGVTTSRIEATFANPNYFALFIGVGWVPVLCYFPRKFRWVSLFIMTVAIIISGSRAALVFPLAYMVWIVYKQASLAKMFAYLSVGVVLVGLLLFSGLTRFSSSETGGSDAERLIFAKIAISMALENPFAGVGWGRFISEFSNYSSDVDKIVLEHGTIDASEQDRRVTHNDLLRIMAELGLVSFALVIFFLLKTALLIKKNKGFGVDSLFPCWFGMFIFSLAHNNLNTAFSWFFFLLPWLLYFNDRTLKKMKNRLVKIMPLQTLN